MSVSIDTGKLAGAIHAELKQWLVDLKDGGGAALPPPPDLDTALQRMGDALAAALVESLVEQLVATATVTVSGTVSNVPVTLTGTIS